MATAAYNRWVADGRPFRLATPVSMYRNAFYAAGWPNGSVGTIGDEAHLQASTPKDHCPFSFTGWPLAHPYPYVTAIDVSHGVSRETTLDNTVLYWISEARAGRTPWVKYIIYKGSSWDVRNNWERRSAEGHYDHAHVSMRTDHISTSIGPWRVVKGGTPVSTTQTGRDVWGETIDSPSLNYSQPAREYLKFVLENAHGIVATNNALAQMALQLQALVDRPAGVVDPLALAQALVAQPGFVDNLAAAVATRIGEVPTAQQIAAGIGALSFQVRTN